MAIAGKGSKKNLLLGGIIAALSLGVIGGGLWLVSVVSKETTYYVLNEDVPTNGVITPELLYPVKTNEGGEPLAAKSLSDIQSAVDSGFPITAKYPLLAGDILTDSNSGRGQDVAADIPDEWVVTSFGVDADSAVGGRIQRGYYFDMMVVGDDGAYYPFTNLRALDTTVSLSSASSSDAANTEEAKKGQTSQYVVGMTPENAAKLQSIVSSNSGKIKLLLAPRANDYKSPALFRSSYSGLFHFDRNDGTIAIEASDRKVAARYGDTGEPVCYVIYTDGRLAGNQEIQFGTDPNDLKMSDAEKKKLADKRAKGMKYECIPNIDLDRKIQIMDGNDLTMESLVKASKKSTTSTDSSSSTDKSTSDSTADSNGNGSTDSGSTESTKSPESGANGAKTE